MARNKQGMFEDVVKLTTKLPWWIEVVLAGAAYLGFHNAAVMDIDPSKDLQAFSQNFGAQPFKTMALFLQRP